MPKIRTNRSENRDDVSLVACYVGGSETEEA